MAKLLTQLDLLDKKIIRFEVLYKNKHRYILPHKHRKPKDYECGQIKEIISLILHKVEEHDRVLKEIKENISLTNYMPTSHSISTKILETYIGSMLYCLYSRQQGGSRRGTLENQNNKTLFSTCVVIQC